MSTTPFELKDLPVTLLRNILQQFPDPEWGLTWKRIEFKRKSKHEVEGDDLLDFATSLSDLNVLKLSKPY